MTVPVGAVGAPGMGEWALPKVGGAEWSVGAAQSQALATGQTLDVTSVVTAVQEASLSMQLASQVRNKAVEAYSEIFRTQV